MKLIRLCKVSLQDLAVGPRHSAAYWDALRLPLGTRNILLEAHIVDNTTMYTYVHDLEIIRRFNEQDGPNYSSLSRGHTAGTVWASRTRKPAKRRLKLSLLSKLSQVGGKTQLEEQLINGTQVRDAPLLAMYVA